MIKIDQKQLTGRAAWVRSRVFEMIVGAGKGHIGGSLSCTDILVALYHGGGLRFDAADPEWSGRDRFIFSKGHSAEAVYAVLADVGFFEEELLGTYGQRGSKLGSHVDRSIPGIEVSTGSLGHGLGIGAGLALAAKLDNEDHLIVGLLGDGECYEGSVWEAAMCAGKHKLANLTAIIDYNKLQSYGLTSEVQDLEPLADKWRSFGFAVRGVDGHDMTALNRVFAALPFEATRPSAVICHTVKGKGISYAEGNPAWHHKSEISAEEIGALYNELRA